jgi:Zn-dependent protease with chaperone function
MNALCISVPSNIRELFASHPSIERRIEALKKLP